MPDKAPDHIGNYQILREIGRGGMGVVYLAQDPGIDRQVALKMLPAELAADETTRQRFLREIDYLSTLEHPHIVPTYGVEINDDRPFLVMRYLPGGTLRERLAENGPARAGLWPMLRQIAAALDYAHGKGLVHRDVKPTNILFDASGNAYISDFGIAKAVNDNTRLTLTTSLTGTPEYMSPEQFQSLTVDGRADQYSLAIILYQALMGELPFQGDTFQLMYQHVYQRPPLVPAATRDVSPGLAAVVERALAKNPADRFDSVAAFIAAAENAPENAPNPAQTAAPAVAPAPAVDDFLDKAPVRIVTGAGGGPGRRPTAPKAEKAAAERRKRRVPLWVWPVAAAAVLGLLFIFTRGGDQPPAAAVLPTLDSTSLPAGSPLPAGLPADADAAFIRVVENGVETDSGWALPGDGAPLVIAGGIADMQLRLAEGSDLYLAPDTEVALARYGDGYRVQIDEGQVVYHAATAAPVYLGNRPGSWVLVQEPGALVGVISRGRPLEFVAHCLAGSCTLKGDLHDTPLPLVAGEAGRVGGSGLPESAGPADYGRFSGPAGVVSTAMATTTTTTTPTAATTPTTAPTATTTPTTRPTATRRPPATARPTATRRPPAAAPTTAPTAAPTAAPPTNTPEPPTVAPTEPPPDDPTPTEIVVPTIPG